LALLGPELVEQKGKLFHPLFSPSYYDDLFYYHDGQHSFGIDDHSL